MREAFLDFAGRCDQAGIRTELVAPFRGFAEIQTAWPVDDGMPPALERPFVTALRDLCNSVGESTQDHSFRELMNLFPSDMPWTGIFDVSDLLNRVRVDDSHEIELWQTRKTRFNILQTRTPIPALMYLFRDAAIAETHQTDGKGWHIHLTLHGHRLAYRFLFDARKTQNDLAWEKHNWGDGLREYGDPASSVLLPGTSADIHVACQWAVSQQSQLIQGRAKFKLWAAKFVRPSRDTYVAHPPQTSPTRW